MRQAFLFSDDRSAEVFKQKIEASTQMKAVMGDEKRPNCLIIDEIDGAPQVTTNISANKCAYVYPRNLKCSSKHYLAVHEKHWYGPEQYDTFTSKYDIIVLFHSLPSTFS